MNRPDKRTGYRHFPQAYTDLLTNFSRQGVQRLGPLSLREANSSRRTLYSFFGFLRAEYDTDEYAKHLSNIARDITLSLEKTENKETGAQSYYLIVDTAPIVKALRSSGKSSP